MPEVWLVRLVGQRQPWVAAKDIIFELLRRLTVKGGVGKIIEYGGPGVADLSVPERGTITNMGAELGATTSIFPSDHRTLEYMKAQGREKAWMELSADRDAEYDGVIEIDLNELEPLLARPHSPDAVVPVREVAGTPVTQVLVGSCTNSSFVDLQTVAGVLRGKTVHPSLSFGVTPGSRQVYTMIARSGAGRVTTGWTAEELADTVLELLDARRSARRSPGGPRRRRLPLRQRRLPGGGRGRAGAAGWSRRPI